MPIPSPEVPKSYRVTEMNDRHHEIARLVLLGMKNREIERELGVSECFVSNVRNSPVVKEQVALLRAERDREAIDIAVQIQETLPECIRILSGQLTDSEGKVSPSLKSKNAFGLLSIGGHGPSKNLSVRGVHAVLTAEDIKEIRERGQKLAGEIGIVAEEAEIIDVATIGSKV